MDGPCFANGLRRIWRETKGKPKLLGFSLNTNGPQKTHVAHGELGLIPMYADDVG